MAGKITLHPCCERSNLRRNVYTLLDEEDKVNTRMSPYIASSPCEMASINYVRDSSLLFFYSFSSRDFSTRRLNMFMFANTLPPSIVDFSSLVKFKRSFKLLDLSQYLVCT